MGRIARSGWARLGAVSLTFTLALLSTEARGDEPGLLGRLFRPRSGGSSAPARPAAAPAPSTRPAPATPAPTPVVPPVAEAPEAESPIGGLPPDVVSPPEPGPRIAPQPRGSHPLTDAPPLVSRFVVGRGDTGSRFGLFLHVYADGTVLTTEGVYKAEPPAMDALVQALDRADSLRRKGHCGGAPTDFVEQVHIVAFERSMGRIRANTFSYSGNLQGCDNGVRQLQAALDAFQARLSDPDMPVARPASTPAAAEPVVSVLPNVPTVTPATGPMPPSSILPGVIPTPDPVPPLPLGSFPTPATLPAEVPPAELPAPAPAPAPGGSATPEPAPAPGTVIPLEPAP